MLVTIQTVETRQEVKTRMVEISLPAYFIYPGFDCYAAILENETILLLTSKPGLGIMSATKPESPAYHPTLQNIVTTCHPISEADYSIAFRKVADTMELLKLNS